MVKNYSDYSAVEQLIKQVTCTIKFKRNITITRVIMHPKFVDINKMCVVKTIYILNVSQNFTFSNNSINKKLLLPKFNNRTNKVIVRTSTTNKIKSRLEKRHLHKNCSALQIFRWLRNGFAKPPITQSNQFILTFKNQ